MGPLNTHVVDHQISAAGQWAATVATFTVALAAVAYVVVLWRRERIVWPIFLAVSGAVTSLMEPLFDHLYGLWFTERGQWHLYTTFESPQPIWVPAAYLALYGGVAVFIARTIAKRPAMRTVWTLYAGVVAMALVAEILYVRVFDVYSYQGPQPYVVLGYPVFLAFTNAMSALASGIIAFALAPRLRRARDCVSLLTLVPSTYGAGLFGAGILYLTVRDGAYHAPTAVLYVAALTVVGGIALTIDTLARHLVAGDAPAASRTTAEQPRAAATVARDLPTTLAG